MIVAYSIGSNIGDRLGYLQGAVDGLAAGGLEDLRVSGVYETDPVGYVDQPAFLNAVLVGQSDLDPRDLLRLGQSLEQAAHRVRTIQHGPRTLDVDVLAVGAVRLDEPDLVVPHPRAAVRAFVLVPWAELDPDHVLPGYGRVADLLAVADVAGVRHRPDLALRVPRG